MPSTAVPALAQSKPGPVGSELVDNAGSDTELAAGIDGAGASFVEAAEAAAVMDGADAAKAEALFLSITSISDADTFLTKESSSWVPS